MMAAGTLVRNSCSALYRKIRKRSLTMVCRPTVMKVAIVGSLKWLITASTCQMTGGTNEKRTKGPLKIPPCILTGIKIS